MKRPSIVLASRSKARAALLRGAGLRFRQIVSDVPEPPPTRGTPLRAYVQELARDKARAVAARFPKAWVIGCDTALILDNRILGKPRNERDAVQMLGRLAGRTHRISSAACLISPADLRGRRRERILVASALVTLRDWSPERIGRHVRATRPLNWAGAYAVQDPVSSAIVARIRGDLATVIGLPLERLLPLLPRHGAPCEPGISTSRRGL